MRFATFPFTDSIVWNLVPYIVWGTDNSLMVPIRRIRPWRNVFTKNSMWAGAFSLWRNHDFQPPFHKPMNIEKTIIIALNFRFAHWSFFSSPWSGILSMHEMTLTFSGNSKCMSVRKFSRASFCLIVRISDTIFAHIIYMLQLLCKIGLTDSLSITIVSAISIGTVSAISRTVNWRSIE